MFLSFDKRLRVRIRLLRIVYLIRPHHRNQRLCIGKIDDVVRIAREHALRLQFHSSLHPNRGKKQTKGFPLYSITVLQIESPPSAPNSFSAYANIRKKLRVGNGISGKVFAKVGGNPRSRQHFRMYEGMMHIHEFVLQKMEAGIVRRKTPVADIIIELFQTFCVIQNYF